MVSKTLLVLGATLALVLAVIGCTGNNSGEPDQAAVADDAAHEAVSGMTMDTPDIPIDDGSIPVVKTVTLGATEWGFLPNSITVPAGSAVRIVFENEGHIAHEVAIDEMPATILARQDPAKMGEVEEDEMDEMAEMTARGVVHVHAAAGESASEVFMATTPGTYAMACELVGHAEAGMIGTIVVTGS